MYQLAVLFSWSGLENLENLTDKEFYVVPVGSTALSFVTTFLVGKWEVKQELWTMKL
jgi:hypothetical protein